MRERPKPLDVVYDMPAAEYHADPCESPSLSSSLAHVLIARSPRHARHVHPRFGGGRRELTATMDAGSAAHAILLGTAEAELEIIDADDWRTKLARAARDAARAAGKVPILRHEHEKIAAAVAGVRTSLEALDIRLTGKSEVSIFWTETADDGTVIQCRGRIDHLILSTGRAEIIDLKTCRSAHPKACESHAYEYGYDIQAAAYRSAISKLFPELAGRESFTWLFAELDEPYEVTAGEPDGSFDFLGESRWRRAINRWAECLKLDAWPGYTTGRIRLSAPPFALAREEEITYGGA